MATPDRSDLRYHRTSNAMVMHFHETGQMPNWMESEIIHGGVNKQKRKVKEAAYLATEEKVNTVSGSFKLPKFAVIFIRVTSG